MGPGGGGGRMVWDCQRVAGGQGKDGISDAAFKVVHIGYIPGTKFWFSVREPINVIII